MLIIDFIYLEEVMFLCWSSFKNLDLEAMIDCFICGIIFNGEQINVFDYMKQLALEDMVFVNYMKGVIFMIFMFCLFDWVVQFIDKFDMDDCDIKGDLYEYLLFKIVLAG